MSSQWWAAGERVARAEGGEAPIRGVLAVVSGRAVGKRVARAEGGERASPQERYTSLCRMTHSEVELLTQSLGRSLLNP